MRHLILILIVCLSVIPTAAQDETSSDAPYLYWYNDYLNAFVIERADGTDSRVFGEGLMPSNTNNVDGPGWSPSGKWFAWTSYNVGGYGVTTPNLPWTISVDGQKRVTQLDEFNHAGLWWSPTEDLLFVVGTIGERTSERTLDTMKLALINPEKDEIIAAFEMPIKNFSCCYDLPAFAIWSADGQHIITYYYEWLYNNSSLNTHVKIFNRDGSLTEKIYPFRLYGEINDEGVIVYIHPNDKTIVVDDLLSEKFHRFLRPVPPNEQFVSFTWHPNGRYALLSLAYETGFWLLDTQQNTLERIFNKPIWPYFIFYWGFLGSEYPWSPDGKHLTFADSESNLYLFNLEAKTTISLVENVRDWRWVDNSHLDIYAIKDAETYRYFTYRYNINLQSSIAEVESYEPAWFSSDGRYAVNVEVSPTIYNFDINKQVIIRPHARKHVLAINGGRINWHPENGWFITAEFSLVSSGGTGPLMRGVIKADGTIRRDLNVCSRSQCANWLPQQVNLVNLPLSVEVILGSFPEPEIILKNTDYVTRLSWSPDSHLLAYGYGFFITENPYWIAVWDTETNTIIQELDTSRYAELLWEQNLVGSYEAVIQTNDSPTSLHKLAISSDGQQYVSWGQDDLLQIYNAETGSAIVSLENSWYTIESFGYSPDGRLLAGAGNSQQVRLWDAESGRLLVTLPLYGGGVAFSPDGKWLAVGVSWDIHIYEMDKIRAWVAGQESSENQN